MPAQIARRPKRSVALRARVSARLSQLFHHPVVVVGEEVHSIFESDARRSTVAEMDRMPDVRVGWTCGLHRCICKTQTLRFSYRSLTSTMFEILGDLTKKLSLTVLAAHRIQVKQHDAHLFMARWPVSAGIGKYPLIFYYKVLSVFTMISAQRETARSAVD
jgi:hypothetical protein